MKFGMESEKFLYDLKLQKPSDGVYSFIDALYEKTPDSSSKSRHVTNEFVTNIVEIVTAPSKSPQKILKDYILNYMMVNSVAHRESVSLTPLAALPMDYLPHLTPKRAYLVQNSILAGVKQESWTMDQASPLRAAGNCTGIHVHAEIETTPEFLFSNRELQDKFNLGLMLTPLIAFASSPYFFEKHEASSMRALRYYGNVYKDFPLNGGLPPVMNSSQDVLLYFREGIDYWVDKGVEAGLSLVEMKELTRAKGAHWNPVRWNRQWNTIELRCLDSDRIDLDAAKFIWIYGAMKRLDVSGEALRCVPLPSQELTPQLIERCFRVKGNEVSILSTESINELFQLAIADGLQDPLVEQYLQRLSVFALENLEKEYHWLFNLLHQRLDNKETTSQELLQKFGKTLNEQSSQAVVKHAIEGEEGILQEFLGHFPEINQQLTKLHM